MATLTPTALVPAGAQGVAMALPPVGTLDAYISAVNRLPMLSPERETELGRRLRDHADLTAARAIAAPGFDAAGIPAAEQLIEELTPLIEEVRAATDRLGPLRASVVCIC